jgi:hypothetical protein
MKKTKILVTLTGIRPLIFDRYPGDNNTKLPTVDKMYLNSNRGLIIPAINLFSLLAAENTKSVCRQFFGKNGKTVALGIASFVSIEPFEIPILGVNDEPIVFDKFGGQIVVRKDVARMAKGIPNPKERPQINLPWSLDFELQYIDNDQCSIGNLQMAVSRGGILGLGTFRPYFGRYDLTKWSIE